MGVLLMLITIGGLFVAMILLISASLSNKAWLAKFTLGGVAVWLVFYAVMLFGISLTSKEKVLAVGEAKQYCGFYLDCHLHTAVTGVRTAKQIGERTAHGVFYIVGVKVFSDARNPSIAFRLLYPKARIVLPSGENITRDTAAEALLPTASVGLGNHIKGSQTIEKEIVFDIADTAENPKLLITEGYGIDKSIEAILVGDEDSLFHAQTFFAIKEQKDTASQNRER
jgi:hypothetical protein